jgi:hypothetical protein
MVYCTTFMPLLPNVFNFPVDAAVAQVEMNPGDSVISKERSDREILFFCKKQDPSLLSG